MELLQQLLLDPLNYQFMQRALIAALLVGAISGIVGTFVVVRGMSFFGDALAHSILPGVAIAFITTGTVGPALFVGGLIAGVGTALGIGWLTRGEKVREDTAIGIVFAAMYALGIAIISSSPRAYGPDLLDILFGHILGIRETDLIIMAVCGIVVVLAVLAFYKELLIISFDQSLARALKLPSEGLRLLLLVLIAVTIIASLQIVGIALMLAMLTIPAATAQLLTKRLHHMMAVSAIIGMVGSVFGLYFSYHLDTLYRIRLATGPTIVLTLTVVFIIVFAFHHLRRVKN